VIIEHLSLQYLLVSAAVQAESLASARLRLEIDVSHGKVIGVTDDVGDPAIFLDGPCCREAALGHENGIRPAGAGYGNATRVAKIT
jgi:hypothetical protein